MEARIDFKKVIPEARKLYEAMLGVESAINGGGLDIALLDLVRMRASQINGCAYCLDMHSKDLRALGEPEQRIYCLPAWEESPFYSAKEKAALAWTEAVTLLTEGHVPDEVYEKVRTQFSESEIVYLTAAIGAINLWNRLNVSLRTVPGSYQSPHASRKSDGRLVSQTH
jgi:AhpD family alkylhydroperoxidase